MNALVMDVALKATILLAAGSMAGAALRRAPAAVRHLLWTLTAAALLLLPALELLLPAWQVRALPAIVTNLRFTAGARASAETGTAALAPAGPVAARRGGAPAGTGKSRVDWIVLVWAVGAAAALARLLVGIAASLHLRRKAEPLGEAGGVAVLRSPRATMPMTVGIFRPAILLPSDAAGWTDERRRIVLAHELAHVRRRDCFVQLMARVAFGLYWFHPLAWWASRQLVREREHASDDLVLAAGFRASDYAAQLLDVARSFQPAGMLAAAGVAMARRSELEGRLLAILDSNLRRGVVSRGGALAAGVCALAVVLPLAAMRPAPQQAEAPREITAEMLQVGDVRLRTLAKAEMDAHLWENAEKLYLRALDLARERWGENSPEFAAALVDLAGAQRNVRGKYQEAMALYARALPIQEAALGPNHPDVATTLLQLGRDAAQRKQFEEAQQKYQRALDIRTSAFGPVEARVAEVLLALAKLTNEEALYQRALSAFNAAGQSTSETATALELYGRYLVEHDRGAEADPLQARAKLIREGRVEQIGSKRSRLSGAVRAVGIGNGMRAPKLTYKVEPAYTDEARAAKLHGAVILTIEVGTDGLAHNIQLKQGIGLGLDESAAEAVSRWTFQPATKDGQPVNVTATVEVNFKLL
jgi:TonB family protein